MKNSESISLGDFIKREDSLRNHIIEIYNYMVAALVVTGSIAMFTSGFKKIMTRLYLIFNDQIIGFSTLSWIVIIAPIGIALVFSFRLTKMTATTAQFLFWTYSTLLGLSLSLVFLTYTGESIASIFFITAFIFGIMSLYGYTTKTDLTSIGSFLIMGLIGVLVSTLINLLLQSSVFYFIISIISIFIFTGLTAFDTQRIKSLYFRYDAADGEMEEKIAIIGALTLYLDFINIFMRLLQLFGKRKEG